jgi:hypothetical protein
MRKIYLVMERFCQFSDEFFLLQANTCGRPERIFTDYEEAVKYCNGLNDRMLSLIPDFEIFNDNLYPYAVIKLETDDTTCIAQALNFNQLSEPTFQQCHETANLFGLPSALDVGETLYRPITRHEREAGKKLALDDFTAEWDGEDDDSEEFYQWQREEEINLFRHYPQPPFAWSYLLENEDATQKEVEIQNHIVQMQDYYEQHLKWTNNEEEIH